MALPAGLLACSACWSACCRTATVAGVLALAATPVTGGQLPDYSLAIWHGFKPAAGDERRRALWSARRSTSRCSGSTACTSIVHPPRRRAAVRIRARVAGRRRARARWSPHRHLQRQLALVAAATALARFAVVAARQSAAREVGTVLRNGPAGPGRPGAWRLAAAAACAAGVAARCVVVRSARWSGIAKALHGDALFVGPAGLAVSLVFRAAVGAGRGTDPAAGRGGLGAAAGDARAAPVARALARRPARLCPGATPRSLSRSDRASRRSPSPCWCGPTRARFAALVPRQCDPGAFRQQRAVNVIIVDSAAPTRSARSWCCRHRGAGRARPCFPGARQHTAANAGTGGVWMMARQWTD